MSRLCLYYKHPPASDRWLKGDRYLRPLARRLIRGSPIPGGVDRVFLNLCLGLDRLRYEYTVNLPFDCLRLADRVGVLGQGRTCLKGYQSDNPIVAGIGLMTHPREWPNLCEEYPVMKYLQHSAWANDIYKPYFGERCGIWPVGIDTEQWKPNLTQRKTVDFLVYNKVQNDVEHYESELLVPIRELLARRGLSFEELKYGSYQPGRYLSAIARCSAMIFLCEHESQGLAYQECLASNVPILAWDKGFIDLKRFGWGPGSAPATSVPYWDDRCGLKFKNIDELEEILEPFQANVMAGRFAPRAYILENLTVEKCASNYVKIVDEVNLELGDKES